MTDDPGQPVILVSDRQNLPVDGPGLIELARETLRAEGCGSVELSLSFVDDEEMEALHVRYMDEPGPTDVLSFPQDVDSGMLGDVVICPAEAARNMDEPGPTDVLSFPLDDREHDALRVLGDVVIAPAVAARNNPDDPAGELRLLLVHGILHILGYDHQTEAERAEMWSRQERLSGVRTP
jgi:probable rRNA maturation factor